MSKVYKRIIKGKTFYAIDYFEPETIQAKKFDSPENAFEFWRSIVKSKNKTIQRKYKDLKYLSERQADGFWHVTWMERIRKRIGKYKTYKEAEAELSKRVSMIAEGSYLEKKKVYPTTFGQMVQWYSKECEHKKSFKNVLVWLYKFKGHFGTHTLAENIKYKDLKEYHAKLRREGKTNNSINREMSCLRHLFAEASLEENGLIPINPFENNKSLREKETQETNDWTPEEVNRLIAACPKHLANIVTVAVHTGMRKSEVLGLRWDEIGTDGFIHLSPQRTKNSKGRVIPIDADVKTVLNKIRLNNKHPEMVFTYAGRPLRYIDKTFKKAIRKAGIPLYRFHDLRHTYATIQRKRGTRLSVLRDLLGHYSVKMTERYAHIGREELTEAAARMDGLTENVGNRLAILEPRRVAKAGSV